MTTVPPDPSEIHIRPSLWPVADICPSAAIKPAYRVDTPNADRALGTAGHEMAAIHVDPSLPDVTPEIIQEASKRYRVDPLKLAERVEMVREAWRTLKPWFPSPDVEFKLQVPGLRGKLDVFQDDLDGEIAAVVLDWKGREIDQAEKQLLAYSRLARGIVFMGDRIIKAIAVSLETGKYRVWDFTAADLDAFDRRYDEIREQAGKVYSPGEHCARCPRYHECQARIDAARSAGSVIVAAGVGYLSLADMAALHPRAVLLDKALDEYRRQLLAMVQAEGPADLGNGKELYAQTSRDPVFDNLATWNTLRDLGWEPKEIADVIEIKKGRIAAKVRAEAPPRGMKRAEDSIMAELRDRGALTDRRYTKLGKRNRRKQGDT